MFEYIKFLPSWAWFLIVGVGLGVGMIFYYASSMANGRKQRLKIPKKKPEHKRPKILDYIPNLNAK